MRGPREGCLTHGTPGALAAKRARATIPIVLGAVAEAVAIGAVEGIACAGGNVTGLSVFVPELLQVAADAADGNGGR